MNNFLIDIEAEQAVLGALLVFPVSINDVSMIIDTDTFSEPRHQCIFSLITDIVSRGEKVDLFSVTSHPKYKKQIADRTFAVGLTQKVGSGSNVQQNARYLKQLQIGRQLFQYSLELERTIQENTEDIWDILNDATKKLEDIHLSVAAAGGSGPKDLNSITSRAMVEVENRMKRYLQGITNGVTTGLTTLDKITNGWQNGNLIILAARPAMGKTAMMLHFAKCAAEAGIPVCIYSLEMQDVSLANRMLLAESDVSPANFRSGNLSAAELTLLEQAAGRMSQLPIYIDDRPKVSMRYIRNHSHSMKIKGRCGMILCDYLQLADVSTPERGRNREQEITQATSTAKAIAKELSVPFIMLSQLNRSVETRGGDKTPMLSDLRESGSIEQDADIVMFINRPAYYRLPTISDPKYGEISSVGVGILSIAKQRDGQVGTLLFSHNASLTRISDFNVGLKACSNEPF